jgi:hypothetical protein
MTTTTDNTARNGVDTVALFTTIGAVTAQPELAKFQFRATNRWVDGTHNRGTINGYRGAGQEHVREQDFSFPADHPPVLNGGDDVDLSLDAVRYHGKGVKGRRVRMGPKTARAVSRYLRARGSHRGAVRTTAYRGCAVIRVD